MNLLNSHPTAPSALDRPAGSPDTRLVFWICLALVTLTWLVFGQTVRFDFVSLDDNVYIYENPVVQQGVTVAGLRWALTYGEIGHWHPLTWLTHMVDCQVYGLVPGGHHLTNVLLHMGTVIFLFLALREMTGYVWRSAFVAAVFAVHPLHVESVAWISERKDVLSGLFFALTIWAYVRWVRLPGSKIRYGVVILFFALGLLSKNMLVTTPFVLLLLDYWPLGRLANFSLPVLRQRVVEKIPLFALMVLSCVATTLVPEKIPAGHLIPAAWRLENAMASCVTYLGQTFYPAGLSCLYVYPATAPPLWHGVVCAALVLAITGGVWAARQTRPWLAVGWFWYLGMLAPVIGIVQMSYSPHADRYAYLPQIGLVIAFAWLVAEACGGWRRHRLVLGGGATVILAALLVGAHAQTAYWRNSESLWTHAIACAPDNFVAHNSLGVDLAARGKTEAAIAQYRTAVQIEPRYAEAEFNLASALVAQDRNLDEAIACYQELLQDEPAWDGPSKNAGDAPLPAGAVEDPGVQGRRSKTGFVQVHNGLGIAYIHKGDMNAAIAEFQKAVQLDPAAVLSGNNLGDALLLGGRVDEAMAQLQRVLQLKPDYAEAHRNLATALVQKGRADEAIKEYQAALKIEPGYLEAQNDLAWEWATNPQVSARNGPQAVALAEQANERTGGADPVIATTLAAAYAEAGRFEDAQRSAQNALHLAQAAGQTDQVAQIDRELELYRAGRPFHREGK